MLPLIADLRSPFEPKNELTPEDPDDDEEDADDDAGVTVRIDTAGLAGRLIELPVPAGNYSTLTANREQLFWLSWESASPNSKDLNTLKISSDDPEVVKLVESVASYELSDDGKKLLVRKGDNLHVIDASNSKPSNLSDAKIDVSDWAFAVIPGLEWKQMFIDAWRMERDYFYDPGMHGNDWDAVRDRYLPLVDRLTDRAELSDLIGEMVGELSSLHIYVFGGDHRSGPDDIPHASLGARLERDESAGGYRVEYVYRSDPDEPEKLSPLARSEVNISEGDVITAINGTSTIDGAGPDALLRRQTGKQVRLTVKPNGGGESRDVIVEPISYRTARSLRYRDWEYTRRLQVEEASDNEIAYVHLRAMSRPDYSDWAREFYPVLNRKGLIIDVRHNNGGNIDTWILTSLLRRPWVYWKAREGISYPNMHNSFAGHLVVICDEYTVSDGELFCEGFRRLGLGEVVGTRTLGGEIWLSYDNWLVDKGIASAAQSGVFSPEGDWVIEGHGFEPDITVENLPHETFNGRDAQLEAAIDHLKEKIRRQPVTLPTAPGYPDKSFKPEDVKDN
jgi:tricorn protease